MTNKRKIIYSILKEIEGKGSEPRAEDYGITVNGFGAIIDMIEEEGLIKGSKVIRGGMENEVQVLFLSGSKITMKGLEYLEENNVWAKTYKGLKEVREWLPL